MNHPDAAASPKRPNSRKGKSSGQPPSARKPAGDTTAPKKARGRRRASPAVQPPGGEPGAAQHEAGIKPAKIYLARDGVAFGPFSDFQIRESIRRGILARPEIALADDGKEWLEVSRLLPASEAPPPPPTPSQPPATLPAAEGDKKWKPVSLTLPDVGAPREQRPDRRPVRPLSERLLREHETHFAHPANGSFAAELTRGRLAFAAVPVAVVLLGLLSLSAVLKHHEPPASAGAQPRFTPKSLAGGR